MGFYYSALAAWATAVLTFVLAFTVFRAGMGRPSNRALAAVLFFSGLSSLAFGLSAWSAEDSGDLSNYGALWAGSLAPWAGLAFVLNWPRRLPGLHPMASSLSLFLAAGVAAQLTGDWLGDLFRDGQLLGLVYVAGTLWVLADAGLSMVPYVLLLWRASQEPERRTPLLLLATGFAIPSVYSASRDLLRGVDVVADASGYFPVLAATLTLLQRAFFVALPVVLVVMAPRHKGILVVLAAAVFFGMLDELLAMADRAGVLDTPYEVRLFPFTVSRLASAAFLAFVVLRGDVPGLAAKFRFGISRSMIAAIFVAAFFIGSEAAQTFFGDSLQNEYIGIAAAGMLVFAFAPLSRLADRLATSALPKAAEERHETYRILLRKVLRDGVVTAEEERALAAAATAFGISAAAAFELRAAEVESLR